MHLRVRLIGLKRSSKAVSRWACHACALRKALPDKDIVSFERADKLDVPAAASVGTPDKGSIRTNTAKGTTAEQAIARIKRDHPELIIGGAGIG